jgi:hypothetical protein
MTMRRSGKQGAGAPNSRRPASIAKKPTVSAPDPIAFAAAAKALG